MALVAPAIDFVLLPRLYVQLINAVASGTQPMIDRYIGHMLSAMALLQGVHVARSLLVTHLLPAFDAHLKLIVLRHILSRDVSCDVLTSGDIVYLLSTMSELSRTWVEWWNNQILPHTALLLCAFTVFLRIDVGLATTFMVFLVTMSLAVVGTHRSAMSVSDHTQSMSVLHKHLEDLIHNVHAIQSADAIDMEMDQLQATLIPNAYREYHRAFSKAQQLQTIMIPVGVVFMLVFLKQIIQLRRSGRIPHSEFVSVFFIIATLINTFTWLMDNLGKIIVQTQNLSQMSAAITRFTRGECHVEFRTPRTASTRGECHRHGGCDLHLSRHAGVRPPLPGIRPRDPHRRGGPHRMRKDDAAAPVVGILCPGSWTPVHRGAVVR